MAMQLSSPAFVAGEPIPVQFTGDGADRSPPLVWSDVPPSVREFALICDDPDAPTDDPWVHWILYRISPETRELPEGIPRSRRADVSAGALQGHNSWPAGKNVGYRGPAPPRGHGVHHYHFRLYGLDQELPGEKAIDKTRLLKLMNGHIVATAELVGTYQR